MARGGKGSGSGSLLRRLNDGSSLAYLPDIQGALVKARQLNGRFAPGGSQFHTLLVVAHRKMAERLQELIVEELQLSIQNREGGERPQRSTQYLVHALEDPKLIDYNADRFIVGTKFLDETPARFYYRNLEEGTSKFLGRKVLAVFTNNAYGNRVGPVPDNARLDVRMIQYPLAYAGRASRSAEGPFLFRIKHPIEPRHYFRKGVKRFEQSGYIEQTYQDLKEALLAR